MAEFVANFNLNNNNLDASFDLSEGASFDALFEIYASGTTWGSIDGDIANQTDLYNILMSKADKTTVEADLEAINDTITENYETLDNKIDSVQSDLSGDISALSQTVINNNTAINNRVDNIVESFDGDIEQINSNISDLQTTVSDNYSELNTKIQNEAAARAESDNLLQGDINILSDNLTAEISNRESADSGLQTQITNLTGTVSSNYNTLNNSISNLSNTVNSNYNILDTKIDTTQTTLQGNIDTLSGTVTSNYNDLTQSITNNVSTLNTRITNEVSTLNGAISDEATARANADNNLQTQIDAIVSSSDVFDIVGTYAELQAYDISTVPVNDIVKVLVDSTHNNAATYYRCVENAGVKSWTYIGSEGAYYTKGEADSIFVPQTRTINNKALNQNINLTASDVGALPVGTQIGNGTILLTQGGVQKGTFTLNQTGNATIDFDAVSEDITVDSELSTTSTNPVQNKVITEALNGKQDVLTAGTDLEIIRGGDVVDLPEGYTQVEHIVLSDTYFDTGIYGDQDTKITTRFYTDSFTTMNIYGAGHSGNTRSLTAYLAASATSQGNWRFGARTNAFSVSRNEWHEAVQDENGVLLDDVLYPYSTVADFTTVNTLGFGNAKTATGEWGTAFNGLISQYIIEKSGDIVANYIPCKNLNGIYGFYDLVSETFKTPISGSFQGGDEVVAGTVINFTNASGYTKNIGTVTSVNNTQPDANGNVTIPTGGTVDQTFDGTSTNAQSGVAIQGAKFLQNTATGTNSLTLLGNASNNSSSINIGSNSSSSDDLGIAVGLWAKAGYESVAIGASTNSVNNIGRGSIVIGSSARGSELYTIAIGVGASATKKRAIQIGSGTNSTEDSLSVGFYNSRNYQLLDGTTGLIPDARLSSNIARSSAIPTSSTVASWGFITGINSSDVTTALGYTPVNPSSLAPVATSGSYNDLSNKPEIYSRNIGEIVTSTLPLSDAGLHLLDGALISGSGIYADFVDYIAGLVTNYPDLFETEANWQSAVTTYGVCGKFVYNSTNNTVRLPKITGILEGTTDVTALGDLVEAGLPNVTGYTSWQVNGIYSGSFGNASANNTNNGALYVSGSGKYGGVGVSGADNTNGGTQINLDASHSSALYGNSNTVQPQAIKVLYYIVLATSTKTNIQVDIDEIATDLNGKADVDLSNTNDTAKILMSGMGMPSNTYIDLTLGASGSTYTAPANGWVYVVKTAGFSGAYVKLALGSFDNAFSNENSSSQSGAWLRTTLPVKKGDTFSCWYDANGTTRYFRFYYAQGSESEAS